MTLDPWTSITCASSSQERGEFVAA